MQNKMYFNMRYNLFGVRFCIRNKIHDEESARRDANASDVV